MFLKTQFRRDFPIRRTSSQRHYEPLKIDDSIQKHEQIIHQRKNSATAKSANINSHQFKFHPASLSQQQNHHDKTRVQGIGSFTDKQSFKAPVGFQKNNLTLQDSGYCTIICTDCGENLPESVLSKFASPRRTITQQRQMESTASTKTSMVKKLQTNFSIPQQKVAEFPNILSNTSTPKTSVLTRCITQSSTIRNPTEVVPSSPFEEVTVRNKDALNLKGHQNSHRHEISKFPRRNALPDRIKTTSPGCSAHDYSGSLCQSFISDSSNGSKICVYDQFSRTTNSKDITKLQIKTRKEISSTETNFNRDVNSGIVCNEKLINALPQQDLSLNVSQTNNMFVKQFQEQLMFNETLKENYVNKVLRRQNIEETKYIRKPVVEPSLIKHEATTNDNDKNAKILNNVHLDKDISRTFRDLLLSPKNSLLTHKQSSSVRRWLNDIRLHTETESLSALQSNCLTRDPDMLGALVVCKSLNAIATLQDRIGVFMADFTHVMKNVNRGQWEKFRSNAIQMCSDVRSLLQNSENYTLNTEPDVIKIQSQLWKACGQLETHCKAFVHSDFENEKTNLTEQVLKCLKKIGESFERFTDILYLKELKIVVEGVEESKNNFCVKKSIAAFISLGQIGEHMCERIVKVGGVRALVTLCVERKWRHLQIAALRALTILCCVPSAVQQMEEAKGIKIITNILCDNFLSLQLQGEVAGLIAQITSPWMVSSISNLSGIVKNMERLVYSLTELASKATTREIILLATAALANLSLLHTSACTGLRKYKSLKVLVSACYHGDVHDSVFVKDQVATVMATMAASCDCHHQMISSGGIELLVNFLEIQPSKFQSQAEVAACERVKQKAVIALSHLCMDLEITAKIAQIQGLQLVSSCKNEERNHAYSALVHCEEALKQIGTVCDTKVLGKLGTTLEENLKRSILRYSSKQTFFI
ncbi:protein inscuteable homolog [Limulus polyphemus]|uniref:Protein inscuteable homolog n=1 Tax=Limulus polyphemus TaxID=6850 RepID=A0ABM1SKQ0_LIMPO|nr:protein inscuteable homolog [Limulus polyphemus]